MISVDYVYILHWRLAFRARIVGVYSSKKKVIAALHEREKLPFRLGTYTWTKKKVI